MMKSRQTTVAVSDQQPTLLADAESAYKQICESGEGYDAADVHRYIHARVLGESAERSQLKRWRE